MRDNLVYMVAAGKLSEDDLIFRTFYRAANYYSSSVDRITLARLVSTMVEARQKGLDPAEKNKMEAIRSALEHKDQEVVAIAKEYYNAILSILFERSLVLRLILGVSVIAFALARLAESSKKITVHRRAYGFYQDNSRAVSAL